MILPLIVICVIILATIILVGIEIGENNDEDWKM